MRGDVDSITKEYNKNLLGYLKLFSFLGGDPHMHSEFCDTYKRKELLSQFLSTECKKNSSEREELLKFIGTSGKLQINEVVIAPNHEDVVGFFALKKLSFLII